MQSSTGVFVRGTLMLACVLVVPLVALFGNKLPDVARDAMGGRWDQVSRLLPGGERRVAESGGLTPPSPATPAGTSGPWASPQQAPPMFAPQWTAGARQTCGGPASLGGPSAPAVLPTGTEGQTVPGGMAMNGPSPAGAIPASYNEQTAYGVGGLPSTPQGSGVVWSAPGNSMDTPAGISHAAVAGQINPAAPSAGSLGSAGTAPPGQPSERFTLYQRRLQELGVVYSLLENWGERGQLYRFYCKVALVGNPNYTRCFDATHSDPLAAMGTVVQEIETWHRGTP